MSLLRAFTTRKYHNITIDELEPFLLDKEKYQLYDVRTIQEYNYGHIKEFHNLDYYQFMKNLEMIDILDKEKPVILICQTGSRSAAAAHMLSLKGFKDVYNVKKGYVNYRGKITR